MKKDNRDLELDFILKDIQNTINGAVGFLLEKHGAQASLAIPAIMLKTTLQIYNHTLPNEDAVRSVIKESMNSLTDLPPLIPNDQRTT